MCIRPSHLSSICTCSHRWGWHRWGWHRWGWHRWGWTRRNILFVFTLFVFVSLIWDTSIVHRQSAVYAQNKEETAKTSTAKTSTAKTSTAKTSTAKTSTAKTSTAKTSTAKTQQLRSAHKKKNDALLIAKENGFINEEDAESPGKLSNTLIALGPGFIVHGLGHWSMRDQEGGTRLLFLEGLGIMTLLTSFVIHLLAPHNRWSEMSRRFLTHMGAVMFVGSWFADILGAYQGPTGFTKDTAYFDQNSLLFGYRYHSDKRTTLSDHIVLKVNRNYSKSYLRGQIDWVPNQLTGVELDFGVYLWNDSPRHSTLDSSKFKLSLGCLTRRWRWHTYDMTQLLVTPYFEWRVSLGRLVSGLKNTTFYQRIGMGWEGYQAHALDAGISWLSPVVHDRWVLTLESGLYFNLFEKTSAHFVYIQDQTRDIIPYYSTSEGVLNLSESLGVKHQLWLIRLINQQTDSIDLVSELILGDTWSVWVMIRWR